MKEVKNMLGSSKMYYRVISIHSEPTAGVLSIKFSSAISLKTSLSMISRASLYPGGYFFYSFVRDIKYGFAFS